MVFYLEWSVRLVHPFNFEIELIIDCKRCFICLRSIGERISPCVLAYSILLRLYPVHLEVCLADGKIIDIFFYVNHTKLPTGLLARGLAEIGPRGGLEGWRWILIIEGLLVSLSLISCWTGF